MWNVVLSPFLLCVVYHCEFEYVAQSALLSSSLQDVEDLVSENALLKEQIEIMEAVCDPLFFTYP